MEFGGVGNMAGYPWRDMDLATTAAKLSLPPVSRGLGMLTDSEFPARAIAMLETPCLVAMIWVMGRVELLLSSQMSQSLGIRVVDGLWMDGMDAFGDKSHGWVLRLTSVNSSDDQLGSVNSDDGLTGESGSSVIEDDEEVDGGYEAKSDEVSRVTEEMGRYYDGVRT
jgi:hypothetical protein